MNDNDAAYFRREADRDQFAADVLERLIGDLTLALRQRQKQAKYYSDEAEDREREAKPDAGAGVSDDHYIVALQQAIESHCRGKQVPWIVEERCPFHARLLNDHWRTGGPLTAEDEAELEPECDGVCSLLGTCVGRIRPVRLSRQGRRSPYNYCETAIAKDRAKGFAVEVIGKPKEQP